MTRATVVLGALALVLAVLAGALDAAAWAETSLWLAALAAGTVALVAGYGVAITWSRRRKRLWG